MKLIQTVLHEATFHSYKLSGFVRAMIAPSGRRFFVEEEVVMTLLHFGWFLEDQDETFSVYET